MAARARRALVVDDEASLRFVVSQALQDRGWEVVVADDGDAVEERIQQQRFDLIVLDLLMPGMNGFEVLRRIRGGGDLGWKTSSSVRVIALSGRAGEEGLEFAQRVGADSVLSKPFDLKDLWAAVEG